MSSRHQSSHMWWKCNSGTKTTLFKQKWSFFLHHKPTAWPQLFAAGLLLQVQLLSLLLALLVQLVLLVLPCAVRAARAPCGGLSESLQYPSRLDKSNSKNKRSLKKNWRNKDLLVSTMLQIEMLHPVTIDVLLHPTVRGWRRSVFKENWEKITKHCGWFWFFLGSFLN